METREEIVARLVKETQDQLQEQSPSFINEVAMPMARLSEVQKDELNK